MWSSSGITKRLKYQALLFLSEAGVDTRVIAFIFEVRLMRPPNWRKYGKLILHIRGLAQVFPQGFGISPFLMLPPCGTTCARTTATGLYFFHHIFLRISLIYLFQFYPILLKNI